jgi:uncharacterized oligopeptide transporter (OPT) family protein
VSSRARRGGGTVDLTERDLPIGIVGGTILLSLHPDRRAAVGFLSTTHLAGNTVPTIVVSLVYVVVIGAVIAAVAGTWPGSSARRTARSPVWASSSVLGIALLLAALHGPGADPAQTTALVAYSLFTTAVVFSDRHRSPTTTFRTSRPGNWSARHRGSSRSPWSSVWSSGRW